MTIVEKAQETCIVREASKSYDPSDEGAELKRFRGPNAYSEAKEHCSRLWLDDKCLAYISIIVDAEQDEIAPVTLAAPLSASSTKTCVCDYPDRNAMRTEQWEAADGHLNQAGGLLLLASRQYLRVLPPI